MNTAPQEKIYPRQPAGKISVDGLRRDCASAPQRSDFLISVVCWPPPHPMIYSSNTRVPPVTPPSIGFKSSRLSPVWLFLQPTW